MGTIPARVLLEMYFEMILAFGFTPDPLYFFRSSANGLPRALTAGTPGRPGSVLYPISLVISNYIEFWVWIRAFTRRFIRDISGV
jgi:hypothetical protein